MLVQFIVAPRSGISYHRLINPMSYMSFKEGETAEMLWEGDNTGKINCDILMYNKYCATPLDWIKDLQKQGMKVVVDVDDLWYLPPHHPNYNIWKQKGHSKYIEEHIRNADIVTCTTMRIQDKVRELNRNTIVIPNAFPYEHENYSPNPQPHDKMTFIYMGGPTHLEDVRLLEGKFRRINSDKGIKDNSVFVLAGYEKQQAKRFITSYDQQVNNENYIMVDIKGPYDKMSTIFSYTGCHKVWTSTNQDEYINYYDYADVSLIPLQDTIWNSMKSNLKIVEAGCKGIPVICSKVAPYTDDMNNYPGVMWVEKNNWLDHIRWCVKNPQGVKDKGKQLAEQVRKEYNLLVWNETRYQVLKSLV